jgi:flagellar biogenesis protein FliO
MQSALIVLGEFLLLVALIGFAGWEVWKLRREKRMAEREAAREEAGE